MRTLLPVLVLTLSPAPFAQTLFVDADLTTGASDGSSWADAFQGEVGLQQALVAATPGTQVWVAEGTYLPTNTGARGASFSLVNGVEVYGGFLGTEATLAERPPIGTAPSVLSGDLGGNDGAGQLNDNSYNVVKTAGTNATAVLDGFTVTGGNANGGGANQDRGGGILCAGPVSPTIRSCRFVSNRCTFGGAAGYVNNGGAPTFTDCSFEDGDGGNFGGAFDIASGGPVRFDRCTFEDNVAARGGALEIFSTNDIEVANSVFRNNTATGGNGGGAFWIGFSGSVRVRNCTVVGNVATSSPFAGFSISGTSGETILNCIAWDNAGQGGAQGSTNQIPPGNTVQYCVVEGGYPGTGNLSADPQLVDLAGGDVTPAPGSPAIDAGANAAVPAGLVLDAAQQPRFVDDPGVADTGLGTAPLVDIGALERQPSPFTSVPGCAGNPATLSGTSATVALGQPLTFQLDAGAVPSGISSYYGGVDGTIGGCGLVLPGIGEVLLGLVPAPQFLGASAMVGGSSSFATAVPNSPGLVGNTFGFQAVTIDLLSPGTPLELSDLVLGVVQP